MLLQCIALTSFGEAQQGPMLSCVTQRSWGHPEWSWGWSHHARDQTLVSAGPSKPKLHWNSTCSSPPWIWPGTIHNPDDSSVSEGYRRNAGNMWLLYNEFGKQGNCMPVLQVSLVCLCPRRADPASVLQSGCTPTPSISRCPLGCRVQFFNRHGLNRFNRCAVEGAKLHPWTSWRMAEH